MTTLYYTPRLLLTLIALITITVPYLADYNPTHVFNPTWPGPYTPSSNSPNLTPKRKY